MTAPLVAFVALFNLQTGSSSPAASVQKMDPVAVVGCLKETAPNVWALVNASDPVVSTPNAPAVKELASLPTGGKNEFRLIGVSVFNLPAYRDQSVLMKGLLIKASPVSRLNVTSVTKVAATCPASQR